MECILKIIEIFIKYKSRYMPLETVLYNTLTTLATSDPLQPNLR